MSRGNPTRGNLSAAASSFGDDLESRISFRVAAEGSFMADVAYKGNTASNWQTLAIGVPVRLNLEQLTALLPSPETYGSALTSMVFADERLRTAFAEIRAISGSSNGTVRLQIELPAHETDLHDLRWELLCVPGAEPQTFLSLQYRFSRCLVAPHKAAAPNVVIARGQTVKGFLFAANPEDLGAYPALGSIDIDREHKRVLAALKGTRISLDRCPGRTFRDLCACLDQGYPVIYIVCHGTPGDDELHLWLEDDAGKIDRVPSSRLIQHIKALTQQKPTLLVLAACHSATGDTSLGKVVGGVAARLEAAGVGAVIGMQGPLPAATAASLFPLFFQELGQHGVIDQAMAIARKSLWQKPEAHPWWMPVLYLNLPAGKLWEEDQPVGLPAPWCKRHRAFCLGGGLLLLVLAVLAVSSLFFRSPRFDFEQSTTYGWMPRDEGGFILGEDTYVDGMYHHGGQASLAFPLHLRESPFDKAQVVYKGDSRNPERELSTWMYLPPDTPTDFKARCLALEDNRVRRRGDGDDYLYWESTQTLLKPGEWVLVRCTPGDFHVTDQLQDLKYVDPLLVGFEIRRESNRSYEGLVFLDDIQLR